MGTFWFLFSYGLILSIGVIVLYGIVDWARRRVRAPIGSEETLYSEMNRKIFVNRYPFQYLANVSITANEIVIEPMHLFESTGQKSVPKIMLEIAHIKNVRICDNKQFTIQFEYQQEIGTALWGIAFQYPYSALQLLSPPHPITLSTHDATIDAMPDMSLR